MVYPQLSSATFNPCTGWSIALRAGVGENRQYEGVFGRGVSLVWTAIALRLRSILILFWSTGGDVNAKIAPRAGPFTTCSS